MKRKSFLAHVGCSLLIIILLGSLFNLAAQQEIQRTDITKKYEMYSKNLNEKRVFTLSLPASFQNSKKNYPLLVILDGEDFFPAFCGMAAYYAKIGKCPEIVIVGIDAKNRWRDYTPTHADIPDGTAVPASGGGKNFRNFIQQELIPFVEKNYRTSAFCILYGHSIAGLFTANAVFDLNSLFSAYIATSPSLWWDDELLRKKALRLTDKTLKSEKYLYLTMGNEGPTMLNPLLNFKGALSESKQPAIKWDFKHFPKVDHQSMPLKAFTYGLEFIFADWQMPAEKLSQGLDAVLQYYEGISKKYRQQLLPPENILNRLGYNYLQQKNYTEAIRVFKLNVLKYPNSANVYDSLGEAYLVSGDSVNAKLSYQKALQLNPDNQNAINFLKIMNKK